MDTDNKQDGAEPPPASTGSVQPLAWGVMPGDNLPLWRCSSKRQAEAVVVWLREQRPGSTPRAVPLVDGSQPQPTLTDAEREAIRFAAGEAAAVAKQNPTSKFWADHAACLLSAAERLG